MPILLSTAYLPPISYFKLIYDFGAECILEACETFQKQSFRNRSRIITPQGVADLVIPLEHGANNKPIREVRISEHNQWRNRHLQAIISAYGKTPFFEYYIDDIAPLYEKERYHFLFDLNLAITQTLLSLLHLPNRLSLSNNYTPYNEGNPNDFRQRIHPKQTLNNGVFSCPPYYHRFPIGKEYLPSGLSIIDLLFNMGTEALLVLKHARFSVSCNAK